ncbi:hypothetical protein BLS_006854 [Venturia inaequalis]|uniref:SRP9 domain-containing protein n=1 Tax=Venturia inaequalis TaxID=5025 RepID=A0A8H3VRU5_VENIN|nr:hypothetical protein BLS_006854 [Venturia inaequalis]KAE9984103.1 hypothetical protein EG328_009153 [Venturia inaequalis]KAE9991699.1 hypothetical protein EG327_011158 [Venturia inaequalis]RDI88219.1 hypothetical protein Vi05172_g2090 [Venturia inaequalis]
MVHYLSTADEWLQQSSLLLKARPTSTRITTKYTIPDPSKAKSRKRKTRDDEAEPSSEAPAETQPVVASLTVKSYDPVSGVCLRYKTSRGWEVGRIVANLGRLGRHMAALPEVAEDTTTLDVVKKEEDGGSRPHTPVPDSSKPATAGQGGGGKKKKKGKK